MKVRLHLPTKELVLLYQINPESEKGTALTALLAEQKISYKVILPEMLGQSLGYLAEYPGFPERAEAVHGGCPEEEFLVISGMQGKRLDHLLEQMKERCPVKRKAIVTDHNRNWSFLDLMREIELEHQTFQKISKLRNLLSQLEQLEGDDGSLLEESRNLLQSMKFTPEELDHQISKVEEHLSKRR